MVNIVAIVGRPNVGKSTLFNRLVESRIAITDPTSGTTRDRHYGEAQWNGKHFTVIDTGGYVQGSDDVFEPEIRKQVELAIQEADSILFLVDTQQGITGMDQTVANMLRRVDKPVFLVANKVDTNEKEVYAAEFYKLGLGEVFSLSAQSGAGTGDLLDKVVETFAKPTEPIPDDRPKIAIVGKPNVGKSSLVNTLLGTDRTIVTPVAGTTRDNINSHFTGFGFDVTLLDTAGIRRKSKVDEDIEFYSVLRSVRAIEESDVCMLLIDAQDGVQHQDLHIFSLIVKGGKGVVVVVNKWDLIEKDTMTTKNYEEEIRRKLAPFTDLPIVFTSVTEKQRIHKALELAMMVHANRAKRIPTRKLNDVMLPEITHRPPPMVKDKAIRIKYVTQLPGVVPAFAFFCNLPQYVTESYTRFLENKLREHFDFTGVPIRVFFRKK
ncbi:MAG: ribosome biogenesis GTPase Der [Flavobacteriales bacterium]|jgi:GTP-binding protein|nr:ribosome biogenesis GTPase Der [Flavobacteriales bacterium]MCB0758276.1 ribosome biogenesis GTPase Der [Flavobacteriales bacterium]